MHSDAMPSNGVAEHRVDAGKSGAGMKGDNKNGREFRENLKFGAHNVCCKGTRSAYGASELY